MKISHTGANFEKPEQKRVDKTYLVRNKNKTIVISKTTNKCDFVKNRSNRHLKMENYLNLQFQR